MVLYRGPGVLKEIFKIWTFYGQYWIQPWTKSWYIFAFHYSLGLVLTQSSWDEMILFWPAQFMLVILLAII